MVILELNSFYSGNACRKIGDDAVALFAVPDVCDRQHVVHRDDIEQPKFPVDDRDQAKSVAAEERECLRQVPLVQVFEIGMDEGLDRRMDIGSAQQRANDVAVAEHANDTFSLDDDDGSSVIPLDLPRRADDRGARTDHKVVKVSLGRQ